MTKLHKLLAGAFILVTLSTLGILYWKKSERMLHLQGNAMGSTYSIKVFLPRSHSKKSVQHLIDTQLAHYDKIFSTYDPESEISQFNRSKTGAVVSSELIEVFILGEQLYLWTQGSWDATVNPLVTLWGFNSKDPEKRQVPDYEALQKALALVGYHYVTLKDNELIKNTPNVTLDFSSTAPGYITDKIAHALQSLGANHIFLEMGGEVLTVGTRPDGKPWRVGINTPTPEAELTDFFAVIPIQDTALATSGDYRNYFEFEGEYYSHIVNPHSGYPVQHRIVSASILAPSCALADGIATAVLVLGRRNGLALIERLDNVEAMIIEQAVEGGLEVHYSKGFPKPL